MLEILLWRAIQASCLAAHSILKVYATDFSVAYKSDASPLTQADRLSHQAIRSVLQPTGLPVLSEEGADISYHERKAWQRYWLVDPLDGTKEFVRRNGEFTVNIALIQNQAPVLGVIGVPARDLLYFSYGPKRAYKLDNAAEWVSRGEEDERTAAMDNIQRLLARAKLLPLAQGQSRPYTVAASRSHQTPELKVYLDQLNREKDGQISFISAGSALKFCLVAEGRADQYPRLGPTMEWDTAAGQCIAECAGARVREHGTHSPLRYNKENLLNPSFIVQRA